MKLTTEQCTRYIAELADAQEIVKSLKQAYMDHAAGRGLTKRYKIKDREMEFASLADMLKQLRWWQQEIARLEALLGLAASRTRRLLSRFGQ